MDNKKKEVLVLTGAGSIGIAIIRRVGAGFETTSDFVDISSRESIASLIKTAQEYGIK